MPDDPHHILFTPEDPRQDAHEPRPPVEAVELPVRTRPRPVSGRGEAVDHERQPGVPPPTATDYDELRDIEGAESFPASDPPSGW